MFPPLQYTPISDFGLQWRFAEDATKWTVLPEADLANFRPLTEDCARQLWADLVSPTSGHLVALSLAGSQTQLGEPIASHRIEEVWSSAEEAVRMSAFLGQYIHVSRSSVVLFFWSAACAVETTWDVLLRYWSDFCYPSDDSNLALLAESDLAIVYCENLVSLHRRR